jgi:hypothetical protein
MIAILLALMPLLFICQVLCVSMNAVHLVPAVLGYRSWVTCGPERKWLDKLPNCVS